MSKKLLEIIREKEKEGKIIFQTSEGLAEAKISDIVKQPAEGLLYDLNRDRFTCSAWIREGEAGWVNNYAVALVIEYLMQHIEKESE
jgi:hypothetical protein